MKRAVLLVLAIAMLAMAGTTCAGLDWCPSFSIGGTELYVIISAEEEIVPSTVRVTVYVPKGVQAEILDPGVASTST